MKEEQKQIIEDAINGIPRENTGFVGKVNLSVTDEEFQKTEVLHIGEHRFIRDSKCLEILKRWNEEKCTTPAQPSQDDEKGKIYDETDLAIAWEMGAGHRTHPESFPTFDRWIEQITIKQRNNEQSK